MKPPAEKNSCGLSVNLDAFILETLQHVSVTAFVFAGEAHSIIGRSQCPPDERSDPAEGTLQHADAKRYLPHQPHQIADY